MNLMGWAGEGIQCTTSLGDLDKKPKGRYSGANKANSRYPHANKPDIDIPVPTNLRVDILGLSYSMPHKSTPPLRNPLRTKSAFSALCFSISPLLRSSAFPPSP
ncbi:hypothetical protein PAXRUDRAFT_22791 [Paxillus rubicundulus Ve08.2h10]|uniref:Uncharacterized protein n=1 Tax=Paxillus rubicundulus Ve08.2h10 TaxID=930991 RepID=A0A0D0D4Q5_9AGAM|nr:hypothetical protein PAXRUDRAFT_22791 [Paxillus rubicundulus Ve08.2h10]